MTTDWFKTVRVSWNGLQQISRDLARDASTWVFRGQKDSCWGLASSLERAGDLHGIAPATRAATEAMMIREFSRRLHHYAGYDTTAKDELLALMQHHGAPTRLVDFTYSPYIAAYFAFERAQSRPRESVAVWAVNTDILAKRIYRSWQEGPVYLEYQRTRNPESFAKLYMSESEPTNLVLSLSPTRLNERQSVQRGAFLCQGNIGASLASNFERFLTADVRASCVVKYVLPSKERDDALDQLDSMNVNRITLFPGLDGFAESFGPRMRYFNHLASRRVSRDSQPHHSQS